MIKHGFQLAKIKSRLKLQMKESEMMKKTDFVISNKGSLAVLKNKIKTLYQAISRQQ